MALPYPSMNFVALDTLAAADLNKMVSNIEYINTNVDNNMITLTVSTTDIGEGATLPANTLYAVVNS